MCGAALLVSRDIKNVKCAQNIDFSPLLSKRWAKQHMSKKGTTVETFSFGKDLEGKEFLEADRHGPVTHKEQEMLQLKVAKEKRVAKLWHECVCK